MRHFWISILALIFIVTYLSPAGAEQRVALVIGNSDYELISALSNPENDAALMAATLREVGFDVVLAKNADQKSIKNAIRDFGKRLRQAGPEATGLFYYAGHGVQAAGTNFLIPLGAPIEIEADLELEAMSASWVLSQMEYASNALNIVILDACRNNPYKGAFRATTRGLARMNAPSGSLVAYSAAPGQAAADGVGHNSPYTVALVAAMREPGLDLEDVFKRVRVAVEVATDARQTPWEESSLKGDFFFVPQNSAVTATPSGEPPSFDDRRMELAFWESIENSNDPRKFKAYLEQYPDGTFSSIARLHIEAPETVTSDIAPPIPPVSAKFDLSRWQGNWSGRMLISDGVTPSGQCGKNFKGGGSLEITISGDTLRGRGEGSGTRHATYKVKAVLQESTFVGEGSGYAIGSEGGQVGFILTLNGNLREDQILGMWHASVGSCQGTFAVSRSDSRF
jgi:uncharacterized caspase-like protein